MMSETIEISASTSPVILDLFTNPEKFKERKAQEQPREVAPALMLWERSTSP